jgi:putative membrane protein
MLWVKTFHLLFVISWFAGLFYLPRLYVNLAQDITPETYAHLLGMARRLYRFMTALAALAILLGLMLWLYFGLGKGQGWMHAKIALVLLVAAYHHYCARLLAAFEQRRNTRSARFYRWFNELPVLLLLAVLILVINRPL